MDGNNEPASVIKNNGLAVCNYVRHHRICVNRAQISRVPESGKPTGWIFSLKFYHVRLEINPICFTVSSFGLGLTPPLWLV